MEKADIARCDGYVKAANEVYEAMRDSSASPTRTGRYISANCRWMA